MYAVKHHEFTTVQTDIKLEETLLVEHAASCVKLEGFFAEDTSVTVVGDHMPNSFIIVKGEKTRLGKNTISIYAPLKLGVLLVQDIRIVQRPGTIKSETYKDPSTYEISVKESSVDSISFMYLSTLDSFVIPIDLWLDHMTLVRNTLFIEMRCTNKDTVWNGTDDIYGFTDDGQRYVTQDPKLAKQYASKFPIIR